MVTFLLVKSIPLSFIISSPASLRLLSVLFKTILPPPVSSVSNTNRSLASVPSASVPSRTRVFPKSSFATLDPSFDPSASVPLSLKYWLLLAFEVKFSWNLSSNIFPSEFRLATDCAEVAGNDSSFIKNVFAPPESSSSSCSLSVSPESWFSSSNKKLKSNLSVPFRTILLPSSKTVIGYVLVYAVFPMPEWLTQ